MKLIIVESPNKVKTIQQFLSKDYVVAASVGHITKIADDGLYNMGIDVKDDFKAKFVIDDGKKDVVKNLKELVARADEVYLAADPDREGEAIAWHLKEQLKIPAKKCKRITYHEVTKKAVEEALKHPTKIDQDLVDAAFARQKLDKIVGYRLSPISRRAVSARSVGRCQSPALKLICEREQEILDFKTEKYYEIWLSFAKQQKSVDDIPMIYKAQYKGLIKDKKNTPTLDNKEDAELIMANCKNGDYIVNNIIPTDRKVSPKPPFITSTLQQEASSRLGYSVKRTSSLAQSLFEGISIGGQHQALITYIRTDDTSLAPEFVNQLKEHIETNYGKDYYVGPRQKKKKATDQAGHEAIRPVDLSMTPEKLANLINDQAMIKLYKMIYDRTLACAMPEAIITDTDYIIENSGYKFIYTEHALKYAGFRKVYGEYDDEELTAAIDLWVREKVDEKSLDLLEKETQPPKRYSEASLIKKLEDLSIGRPSTFASIISTLLDPKRGYCEEQGKALVPTEKGMQLTKFLVQAFPDVVDYGYTAKLEDNLDLISKGKIKELEFLTSFYAGLEAMVKQSRYVTVEKKEAEIAEGQFCPECGKQLVIRNGRFGKFLGCSGYARCKYTKKLE